MLSVIDEKWRAYLTQMEHLRTRSASTATVRWTRSWSTSRSVPLLPGLMAEIQRDIVASSSHQVRALQLPGAAALRGARGDRSTSPRADQPGSGRQGRRLPRLVRRGRPGIARRCGAAAPLLDRRRRRPADPGAGDGEGRGPVPARPRCPLRPVPGPSSLPNRGRRPGRAAPRCVPCPSPVVPAASHRVSNVTESSAEAHGGPTAGDGPQSGQRPRIAAQDGAQRAAGAAAGRSTSSARA